MQEPKHKSSNSKEQTYQHVVLFQPSDLDLRLDYPELFEYSAFEELTPKEVLFVWYFGNRTSPYYLITDKKKKLDLCIKASFGYLSDDDYYYYSNGKMPPQISIAIEQMQKFNPSYRLRAKMGIEKIFNIVEDFIGSLSNITDVDEIKKASDVLLDIAGKMESVVKQLEQGYGIKTVSAKALKEEKGKKPTAMDIINSDDN